MSQRLKSVLLIDDDTITNYINTRLLKKAGVENLMVCMNGREALDCLRNLMEKGEESPSAIFLDINMPVMNGFEFVEKYETLQFKNKDQVKIYMLTTSDNLNDINRVKGFNCVVGYLNKPLTEEKIQNL